MATTRRLGEMLVDAHLVSAHVIEREIRSQTRSFLPRRLGEVLVESGAIDRRSLVDALAAQAHRGTVDVLAERVDPAYLWKVPKELASSLRAIVLAGPRIAMADPLDARAIAMMRRLVGDDSAEVVAADDRDIAEAIERHYDMSWVNARRLDGVDPAERPPQLSPTGADLDTVTMLSRLRAGNEEAVPDFVTALLVHAVEWGAEGVELEGGEVSFVLDGFTTRVLDIPRALAPVIHLSLRARAGIRPLALARAGEGAAILTLGDHAVPIRGAAKPGFAGGSLELDLRDHSPVTASQLGMDPKVAQVWQELTAGPGLTLLVGSAHSGLSRTAGSVGDAFHIRLSDAGRVAEAIDAALDGRTVLGVVSAPNAAEAIALVRELHGDASRLAAALRGVVVQRRLRRVCSVCALPPEGNPGAAERFGVYAFAAPRAGPGCPACRYRGYEGSIAIYELVENDPDLAKALVNRVAVRELAAQMLQVANRTLQVDGVAHAIAGRTTTEEFLRVLPPAPRPVERQHRGLMRAITRPGFDTDMEDEEEDDDDPPTHPTPPSLLIVHADPMVRVRLRRELGERASVRLASELTAVRSLLASGVPDLVVLDTALLGPWALAPVRALRDLGTRVVLAGPEEQADALRAALELGRDDQVASFSDLRSLLEEWLSD